MENAPLPERNMLWLCSIAAPLLQLAGDSLWLSGVSRHWSLIREAGYLFFVPLGFFLYKLISQKRMRWAIVFIALFIIGCFGVANMMPLFHLGAYDSLRPYEFPFIVNIAFSKDIFAVTIFLPGLCFPLSHVVLGVLMYRYQILSRMIAIAFITSGIFFWLGNAGEQPLFLIGGDACMLVLYTSLGWMYRKNLFSQSEAKHDTLLRIAKPTESIQTVQ